jgi:hypothetical protein
MAHIPTTEADDQKVLRIARELGISLEDAALTCAGFELAFSDGRMRRAIFEIIDQLDDEAYKKGEPLGTILSYAVEVGMDGIQVSRYADEIPPGKVVSLTPTNRAMIFLRINDNFPTQHFLGPLMVNRPELPSLGKEGWQTDVFCRADGVVCSDSEATDIEINKLPSLAKEGLQADVFCRADGVICSDSEIRESELPTELPSHWPDIPICLGPIRLTFNEHFQLLSAAGTSSQLNDSRSPLAAAAHSASTRPLHATTSSHLVQPTSGLSPPPPVGDRGHSGSKDVPRSLAITVETRVSHLDL